MVDLRQALYLIAHPKQLRSILQWKLWHQPVHRRNVENESPTTRECFKYLSMTSRSFSLVIQELHPELLLPVTLFYLILRGLDTIEDDMTIPLDRKIPLLRNFQDILEKENWNFNENGPSEKDRELLVHFDVVIAEFKLVKPVYKKIIKDITEKMGNGMADYAINAEHNVNGVNKILDYELYCHYAAGLVGEGLTKLFVESGLANSALLQQPDLAESMGQFLQKTNIIRDVREDFDDGRKFWPKEIWSKHVENFEDLFSLGHRPKALNCCSEMVMQSLCNVNDCLLYMAGIKDQSVFNFVAIPQAMAIATLELVFRNPKIFETNVKITKGDACQLMIESTQNFQSVCKIFQRYAQKIHKRNCPRDPNYMQISIACANIEKYIESLCPTQDPQLLTLIYNDPSKKKEQSTKNEEEAYYLTITVLGTLILLSAAMIGLAYFASLRLSPKLGGPLKASEVVHTAIPDKSNRSEL